MFAKETMAMFTVRSRSIHAYRATALLLAFVGLALAFSPAVYGDKKKRTSAPPVKPVEKIKLDISKLVWPSPPYIARVKFLAYYAGMKIEQPQAGAKKKPKKSWMDRLAGTQQKDMTDIVKTFPFQLIGPYGIGIDSHGLVYVADQKVGAVFIFNTETRDVQLIRNGQEAHFGLVNGIALDDTDRLFVSDGKLHRVLVFKTSREGEKVNHEVENVIEEGLQDPVGLAIDEENRFLYVVDTQQDQVLVYDADTLKLLRRIGTSGKNHWLTTPGDFAAPSNVAVDKEGNVYVTDTLNNRVEIFDPDGKFVSLFGRHGDGPGYFARPKGIAIDGDGHIWVVDQFQDRVQVFDREGHLLTYLGEHGNYPGQFASAVGIAIDKNNRVFVTDQYPARLQMFRYVTDAEADAEKKRREQEAQPKPPAAKEDTKAQTQISAAN
jgi:DNA-binding beta-propeller fold protein YncE